MRTIGIGWQLSSIHGWGVFGANLALQAGLRHELAPTLFFAPQQLQLQPLQRRQLAANVRGPVDFEKDLRDGGGRKDYPFPILYALGNQFAGNALLGAFADGRLRGSANHGFVFFENTALTPAALALARRFDRLVAGSTWNAEILRARGLTEARAVFQGIDETLFHPAPRAGLFPGRFVIFSGGKLEYRKGQDIVLAAFRVFRQRHPEALLLASWFNPWPDSAKSIARSPLVKGAPLPDGKGGLALAPWLAANGLPDGSFIDVGMVPNPAMASVLREADCAIFPNRCEGGTNLVAMEAMACGIPTILAGNSGQRDLIAPEACYVLTRQDKVRSLGPEDGVEGWGESSVEEAVEALEAIYLDRAEAARRAAAGAARMREWSWARQTDALLAALGIDRT